MSLYEYQFPQRTMAPERDCETRRDSWFEISFDEQNEQLEKDKMNNTQIINKPIHAKLKVYKLTDYSSQPTSPRYSFSQPYTYPRDSFSSENGLPRSSSMPVLNADTGTDDRYPPTSSSSRKTSLVSNCRHRHSRAASAISMESATSLDPQDQNNKELGCSRHHHRRGSVAIKFRKPEFIVGMNKDKDSCESPTDKNTAGGNVQESLGKFELKN